MSDTPRTDAACGWPWGHHGRIESSDLRWSPDGPFVHSEVARELEEENRRLHVELDAYHNGEQLRVLRAENAALRAAIAESEEFARKNGETLAAKVKELLDENAALRKDKERLDWLVTPDGTEWLTWQYVAGGPTDGAAIDAGRKEAQS